MTFETKANIKFAFVVIGALALFSLPIFLMGMGV